MTEPPLPTADDRMIALALIRAVAHDRPGDLPAIWREDRAAEVGLAGLSYAALLLRQTVRLMRLQGDTRATVDELLDALVEQLLRQRRKAPPEHP